jgi:EAL domain-containing protein (putative c-di-GMP-specific phosphodiesterase class I)
MGYGRELPWLLAVALCAAVPFFVGVYSLSSKTMNGFYWSGAAIAMACGLFVMFALLARHTRVIQRDLRKLANEITAVMRETREERRISADLSAQVSVLRAETEGIAASLSVDMNDLRQGQIALAGDLRSMVERQYQYQNQQLQNRQRPVVVHASQWAPQEAAPQALIAPSPLPPLPSSLDDIASFADSLVVSLEPVIDLFSGKTAHYRLHHSLAADTENNERRPAVDVHVFREALVLLKRLRKRDNRLTILVPISSATLGMPEALSRLVQLHASEPGTSEGLVVDVPHAVLASLPQTSIEGLAYLARSGLDMSLSNAAVAGLDLAALDKLNVRYVGISSGSVGQEPKQSAGIANFVQAARALHVQVIVTGVANAQQATQLMRVARFASGPAFAEPRRVRRDAVGLANEDVSAAAE